jgi:CheY-like chemotaxis protein
MEDPTAAPRPPVPTRQGGRVLVVDDDRATRVVMGRLVETLGIAAVGADTCAAARDAAAIATHGVPQTEDTLRLVICDRRLPDGDGLDLLATLRRDHRCRTIVLSGFSPPADGAPPWVDRWLTKPADCEQLRTAIAEQLAAPPITAAAS